MYSSSARSLWAVFLALSAVAALLVAAPRAAAVPGATSTFDRIDDPGRYKLTIDPDRMFHPYGRAIRGIEKSGAVTRVSPLEVASERDGQSDCPPNGLNGMFKWNNFCWNATDQKTTAHHLPGGWHPQGLTASHDAYAGGTFGGRHLIMTSWYYGMGQAESERHQYARVSVVDSTGSSWKYGNILLVRPTGDESSGNFTEVSQIHADGIAWYGNKLFVANGSQLQVYDLQFLWKVNTFGPTVGIADGKASAFNHQWVLPMVGEYRTGYLGHVFKCDDSIACLNSLSVQRSVEGEFLVSGEYERDQNGGYGGRVFRWRLNDTTDLPDADNGASIGTTTAYDGYRTPVPVRQLQGVATDGTTYYLSAQCPAGYMGDPDTADEGSFSCIYETGWGRPATVLTRAPVLLQNLSYSPASGRLWGMNEKTGMRLVFSIIPGKSRETVYLENDYSKRCAGAGNKVDRETPVIQWECINAQDERWMFEPTRDPSGKPAFFLRNEYSNMCIGVASSLTAGTEVIQWPCNGKIDEKWLYTPEGTLRNAYSDLCLALGHKDTKGSHLIQWTCTDKPDEKWNRVPR